MAYTIGHLAKQLGVGRETLRHYEDRGLIVPKRDEANGYRYFDDMDGLNVLHTKLLQSYQLPLSRIHDNMHLWTLSQQEQYLARHEKSLRLELAALEKRLKRIARMRSFIEDSLSNPGSFWEAELDGLYKILLLGDGVTCTPRLNLLARDWGSKFPITDIGWHIRMDDVDAHSDKRIPVAMGLTVLPEYVNTHHYDIAPPAIYFPGGHSVRTIVSLVNPFDLHYENLKPFLDYIRLHDYRIISDLTGRYGGCEFMDGAPTYFFTLRAIVEENSRKAP